MNRLFLIILMIFFGSEVTFSTSTTDQLKSPVISKILKPEMSTPQQQLLYLEQFSDLLNIIDDDKKRETFLKNFTKFFTEDFLSLESYKNVLFYFLKLSIVAFAYFILKRLGMKLLNYQMHILATKRKEKSFKNLNDEQNYLILETLAALFKSVFIWILRILFTLLFLVVMGVSVGPLMYVFSFLGIGITFASQNIIKDLLNGVLVIMDGSMAVGEVVEVDGHKGSIENIKLRSLSIRNQTGDLITIPFSSISEVINYSRHFAKIRSEIIISHIQNLDDVREAFEEAFLKTKVLYPKDVKENLTFLGVVKITEFGSHVAASFLSRPDPTKTIYNAFNTNVHTSMQEKGISRIDGRQF